MYEKGKKVANNILPRRHVLRPRTIARDAQKTERKLLSREGDREPRGVRMRAIGGGRVAGVGERRFVGHRQLGAMRDVHQAGDEEKTGHERRRARERAREARVAVPDAG